MTHVDEYLFALIRAAMGGEAFEATPSADEWRLLYREAARQSLLGMCFQEKANMPTDVALKWVAQTETIRGLNTLLNKEAARLTQLFAAEGHRTAILKGQANALLYPNPLSRHPGDIDIWVEGGRERVLALLRKMGLIDQLADTSVEGKPSASYHHVHLPPDEHGVTVEVHFRPSSGNFNPITNRRLQRWLEREITCNCTTSQHGFCMPSLRFALMMQLAHVQRHFVAGGIGLRQVCDYYCLLTHATADDRRTVAEALRTMGLRRTAGALMWVLAHVLHMDEALMLCPPDSYRGEWMLREIMDGGNFGHYNSSRRQHWTKRVIASRVRNLRQMRFCAGEALWVELNFWRAVIETLPTRIRYRTFSLAEVAKRNEHKQ